MEEKMAFRCYAYWDKNRNKYYACCIDLNLVDCADSMEEVVEKLEENIIGYLQTVFENPEAIKGLIPRKAPLSYCLQYRIFSIKLAGRYLLDKYTSSYKSFIEIWQDGKLTPVPA